MNFFPPAEDSKKQEREFVDNVMTDTLDDSKDKDDDPDQCFWL